MWKWVLGVGLCLAGVAAHSQSWPLKPVKVVLGFPAGSSGDLIARVMGRRLGEILGQPIVVENRAGAGSNIAAEAVVRAPGDGYTLLMGTIANTINPSLMKGLPFNFAEDLAPVSLVASVPTMLVVHPQLGANTVQALIAAAKSKPGEILYGSSGNGTANHLAGELFNTMAGVKMGHVPYKGSNQAVADLLGGRFPVMFAPASSVLQHIQAGKLVALASTGPQRSSVAPTLPTIAEAGLAGFDVSVWFGLLAPAATPAEIIERAAGAAAQSLATADVKSQLNAQGIDTVVLGPRDFGRYIRTETEKWARVVQMSGAKAD